jgi:hypothetical protein
MTPAGHRFPILGVTPPQNKRAGLISQAGPLV